jgi:hypothetical protein
MRSSFFSSRVCDQGFRCVSFPIIAMAHIQAVQEGSRVRIEGLQAKPEMNGRTGVVCSVFDQQSGRWMVAIDANDAGPAFQISIRPANLILLPTSDFSHTALPHSTSANTRVPPAASTVQEGSRVRIEGLQAKPEMNGRTGVVCSVFDQQSGRWMVDLAADGAKPAFRGSFRSANLRLIPSHNFSTEWLDESGRLWPKNVDFLRQCAKGHALAPLGNRGRDAGVRLMCRLCHCFCGPELHEAASWLMCSDDVGCCGDYAVCCSCAGLPSADAVASTTGSDNVCTLVSCDAEVLLGAATDVLRSRVSHCLTCRGCGQHWARRWAE